MESCSTGKSPSRRPGLHGKQGNPGRELVQLELRVAAGPNQRTTRVREAVHWAREEAEHGVLVGAEKVVVSSKASLAPVDQEGRGLLGGARHLAPYLRVAVGTGHPPADTEQVSAVQTTLQHRVGLRAAGRGVGDRGARVKGEE